MSAPNAWTLRAAHRLDNRDICIDCALQFGDIEEHAVAVCDTAACALGAPLKADRDAREQALKFQEQPNA